MALTKLEKLMFPGFLLAFEVVFLILFGLLVRYDDNGGSVTDGSTAELSQQNTIKVYPCKPADLFHHKWAFYLSVYIHAYMCVC